MYTWLKPKWLRKLGPGDLVNYYYTQMQRDIDIVKLGTNLSLQLFMLLLFALLLIKEKKKTFYDAFLPGWLKFFSSSFVYVYLILPDWYVYVAGRWIIFKECAGKYGNSVLK